MEVVELENFNRLEPSTMPMSQFNPRLSDELYQDASNNEKHIFVLLQLITTKGFIYSFLTIILYHWDSCTK